MTLTKSNLKILTSKTDKIDRMLNSIRSNHTILNLIFSNSNNLHSGETNISIDNLVKIDYLKEIDFNALKTILMYNELRVELFINDIINKLTSNNYFYNKISIQESIERLAMYRFNLKIENINEKTIFETRFSFYNISILQNDSNEYFYKIDLTGFDCLFDIKTFK